MMIIFIVLLVLLILISTFGGSVYVKESFEETERLREEFWEEQANDAEPAVGEPAVELPVEEFEEGEQAVELPVEEFEGDEAEEKVVFTEEPVVEGFDGDMYATVAF